MAPWSCTPQSGMHKKNVVSKLTINLVRISTLPHQLPADFFWTVPAVFITSCQIVRLVNGLVKSCEVL
jgi:hypothetical protein